MLSNLGSIHYTTLLISVCLIAVTCLAVNKASFIPWYLILAVGGIALGMYTTPINGIFNYQTFGGELSRDSDLQAFIRDVIDSHPYKKGLFKFKQPLQLDFFLNCMFLALMTMVEASVTIRLTTMLNMKRYKPAVEMYTIGASNIVSGILGLLPLGFPICRNILTIGCGARSVTYTLFCLIFIVGFTMVFLKAFMSIPIILKSIISISVGISLLDIGTLVRYIKARPFFGQLALVFVLLTFFIEVGLCVFYLYVIFFCIYLRQSGSYGYTVVGLSEINTRLALFAESHPDCPKSIKDCLKRADLPSKFIDRYENITTIYQFRGLFCFLHVHDHMSNLKLLGKRIVILDFSYVIKHDIEMLGEYLLLVSRVLKEPKICVFVAGIPYSDVKNDPILQNSWVKTLSSEENERVIFTS